MLYLIIIFPGLLLGFLIYASASIRSNVYVKAICKLNTTEKVIALTFDDGPDASATPQVLDVLAKYNIPAVFFCIGNKIKDNAPLLQRISAEGHLIGNHSYSHVSTFPLFSIKKMKADIQQCEAAIREVTGRKELSLFRPPFGVTNPTVAKALRQLGYTTLGWNIRSLDTAQKDFRKTARRVNKRLQSGSIILLHDNLPDAPRLLEDIIKFAQQNGYRLVRADKFL